MASSIAPAGVSKALRSSGETTFSVWPGPHPVMHNDARNNAANEIFEIKLRSFEMEKVFAANVVAAKTGFEKREKNLNQNSS
jgi:hypothetical protein